MGRRLPAVLIGAACFSAACGLLDRDSAPAEPTVTGVQQLEGRWASVSTTTTLTSTCTKFTWVVSEISGSTGTGSFTATCLDGMAVTGSASGSLSGDTVTWSATANGTAADGSSCLIMLSGTAVIESAQIRVPYTGSVCGTTINGIEILRKD